jgi:cobyrinic acid a,c-diamide synthase
VDGAAHALWGLLPGVVSMQKRLAALGPQQLEIAGAVLRGHTFHYSTSATPLPAVARTARPGQLPVPDAGEALWQYGSIRASYFHAWFASSAQATAALFLPAP